MHLNLRRLFLATVCWLSFTGIAHADPITDTIAFAALVEAIGSITISSVLASIAESIIVAAVLGGLGALLAPKNKAKDPISVDRTQMVKEPISPRQIILGRSRVSGAITFLNTYNNYKTAEYNVTFAGHPCDAVEQVYFDDNLLTLDANGMVVNATDEQGNQDATWIGNAWIKIGLGTPSTDADWLSWAEGQTSGDWTANHKQTGCSKMWITLNSNNSPGGGSIPNISAIVRGLICYDPRTSLSVWTSNPALCMRQYLIQLGIVDVDGTNIDDTRVITAANICDEIVESLTPGYAVSQVWISADNTISAESDFLINTGIHYENVHFPSAHPFVTGDAVTVTATGSLPVSLNSWTTYWVIAIDAQTIAFASTPYAASQLISNGFDLDGTSGNLILTKGQVNLYHDALTLAAGATSELKPGDTVIIDSTGTVPTGLVADTEYYLIIADVANNIVKLAATYADALASNPIKLSTMGSGVITLAKDSEVRYSCNGVLTSDTQPIDSLPNILGSMVGSLVYVGGYWIMLAGAYSTPSIRFNEDDLDGPPTTQTKISLRDSFNSVKGTFYNPAAYYEQDSYPSYQNDNYIVADGAQSWNSLDLAFTNSPGMCQRIAKCLVEGIRQQITTSWPMKLTALQVQVGDIVMLNRTRLGWVDKPFQITSWKFSTRGSGEETRLGIDVTMREVTSAQFDWNQGDETAIDSAPNTNLPNAFIVDQPGAPVISEREVLTNDSESVKSVVDVSWLASTTNSVANYQIAYRSTGSAIWTYLPLVPGSTTATTIYGLDAGYYDFQVVALNTLGVSSAPSQDLNQEILAALAVPSNIQNLTIQEVSALAILRWTLPPELSVRINGTIHIRHSEASLAGASLANSVEIIPAISGNSDHAIVPLKAGTYLVYAVNSAGAASVVAATISSVGAEILAFSTVNIVQEDPSFPGTNSNTVTDTHAGILKLAGTGLWDSITNFDLAPDIDDTGGVNLTGTYTFSAGIDLGSVTRVRLLTRLQILAVNTSNAVDSRIANIDDWPDFDGLGSGFVCNAQIQVRYTNDNPIGSPTWGAWNWLVCADYTARAFQFQVVLTVSDPAYNVYISALGITAKQP